MNNTAELDNKALIEFWDKALALPEEETKEEHSNDKN